MTESGDTHAQGRLDSAGHDDDIRGVRRITRMDRLSLVRLRSVLARPLACALMCTLAVTLACMPGFDREEVPPPTWTPVLVTPNVTIAIDTAGAARFKSNAFVLRVRTDHAVPRNHDGKPWDREITGVVLHCGMLSTKTYHVRLSLGDDDPIVFQLERERDVVAEQPWRVVEPRSDEEAAARVACSMLDNKPVDPKRDGQLRLRL